MPRYHSFEAFLGRFPVDDIPDGAEVLGFAVFVLEAVRDGGMSVWDREDFKIRFTGSGGSY